MLANDIPATPPAPQRPALSAASQEAVMKLRDDLIVWGNDQLDCEVLVPSERERLDIALAPLVARFAALERENAELRTPEFFWLEEYNECGGDLDLISDMLLDDGDDGVHRVLSHHVLPDHFVVLAPDPDDDDGRVVLGPFATREEAARRLPRPAPPAGGTPEGLA